MPCIRVNTLHSVLIPRPTKKNSVRRGDAHAPGKFGLTRQAHGTILFSATVARRDLDPGRYCRETTFDFAPHRRVEHYRMIVDRTAALPPLILQAHTATLPQRWLPNVRPRRQWP
jgi:hypothetical protein